MSCDKQRAADLGRQTLNMLDSIAAQGRSPTRDQRPEIDEPPTRFPCHCGRSPAFQRRGGCLGSRHMSQVMDRSCLGT